MCTGRPGALHGAAKARTRCLCLGDLLLFVDYADHGQGIFAELFGAEAARQFVALRTAKRFDEARAMSAGLWQRLAATRPSTSGMPPPASTRSCSRRCPSPPT